MKYSVEGVSEGAINIYQYTYGMKGSQGNVECQND